MSVRIRELVDELTQGNVLKFASKVGTSDTNIRNYISGRNPRADILSSISKEFNVNLNWLLTGEGNKYLKDSNILSEPMVSYGNAVKADKMIMHVPLVHQYAYAGYMAGYGDQEFVDSLPTYPFTVDNKTYKGKYVAFEVRGDSMDDGSIESCPDRSIVLAREVQRQHWVSKLHINKWLFVIVHKTDGIMIKEITHHDVENGILTLHSLNELYEDYQVRLDDVAQIFNVVKRVLD